jgi:hypothetical protein
MALKLTGWRMETSTHNYPSVLIEGPNWGDAKFYGKWLLAAAQAETFWKEARKDPDFEKQVRVCAWVTSRISGYLHR